MSATAPTQGVDRRDEVRRRVYLLCLGVGIPSMAAIWAFRRADPFVAVAYPLYTLSLVHVMVGLVRQRMSVQRAELIVLIGTTVTFLSAFVIGLATTADLAELRAATNVSALLTINLMAMLAYVAFEPGRALRVSMGIVGVSTVSIAARLVPEAMSGELGGEAADYISIMVFLLTSVGLLHVMAQVREQAAEARSAAATLHALANTDALTGIANRRHLHDALEHHVGATDGSPVAVILLDLDHFKHVNDTHGHDVGDLVLSTAAAVLGDVARPADLVGRWGGEEFLIIAPGTSAEEAEVLAEAFRVAIAAAVVPPVGQVTASLGIATRQDDDTAWTLLRRADDALYRAKAGGRDRVLTCPDARG